MSKNWSLQNRQKLAYLAKQERTVLNGQKLYWVFQNIVPNFDS